MIRNAAVRLAIRHGAKTSLCSPSSLDTTTSRAISVDHSSTPKRSSPPPFRSKSPTKVAGDQRRSITPSGREDPSSFRAKWWSSTGAQRSDARNPKPSPGGKRLPKPPSDPGSKHLLRPSVLAQRLNERDLDEAILMLKSAPLGAQNTIVWNGVVARAMGAKRYNLAYQLYIDVSASRCHRILETHLCMAR